MKVILNRRKDVDAWDQSFRSSLIKGLRDNWWLKALAVFSPDYFWLRQITRRFVIGFFNGSFEKHGLDVYRAHYRQLEDMMGDGKFLDWTVEDGWYVARFQPFHNLWWYFESHWPMLIMVKGAFVRFP